MRESEIQEVKTRGWLRRLVVALFVTACTTGSNPIVETQGNALPQDMALPTLSGSVEEIGEQFCTWVADNQLPFPQDIAERVYVEHLVGMNDGRYVANSLLHVFLQRTAPQQLIILIDADALMTPQTGQEEVYGRIDRAGIWSFSKIDLRECDVASEGGPVRVAYRDLDLCVLVQAVDFAPPDAVRADYRDLFFQVSTSELRLQQPIRLQVMSLLDGDIVVGRSIRAYLWAGAMDVGRVNRVCRPSPEAIAFQPPTTRRE